MPQDPRIIAFAGSTRKDSYNKKLVQIAAKGARSTGAEVTVLDLKDFPLPLFDEDLEAQEGLPANAAALKKIFIEANGFLIASPEYNGSISAVLKNTIDWISRPVPGEPRLAAFSGKVVCLMSAAPGAIGGLRGLVHVRSILGNIGMLVLPGQIAMPKAHEMFQPDGALKDNAQNTAVEDLGKKLSDIARKLMS